VEIKSRSDILNDVIRDAKKFPTGWKALFGKDYERLSRDYYLFHPESGIYLLKEYQKNPFEVRGIGGKIARYIDDDIEKEMKKYSGDFGIIQGDFRRIAKNLEKGIPPKKIFDAAFKRKNLGISMPVRGHASTLDESFTTVHHALSTKRKKIDETFEKMASDDGLYSGYD